MTTRTFLGIPIDGDITDARRTPQRTLEEFAPILQAVIDDPLFRACGWRQYTPYFNDGEACEFSAYGFWIHTTLDRSTSKDVDQLAKLRSLLDAGILTQPEFDTALDRLPDEDDDPDENDDFDIGYGTHPTLGGTEGYGTDGRYVGEHEDTWRNARALSDAIDAGTFYDVLLAAFGDHAKVVVYREGISVESYEHD